MYGTLSGFKNYELGRYAPDAEQYSDEAQTAALVEAGRKIDRLRFIGRKVSASQEGAFPRILPIGRGQREYTQTEIPQVVVNAAYEETSSILKYAADARIQAQQEGVKSLTIEDMLSESYFKRDLRLFSQAAKDLLSAFTLGAVIMR